MLRNIFTGLFFETESDEILLAPGSGARVDDYRGFYGHLGKPAKRVERNEGNALVRDFRVSAKLSGKR